jgi:holo-[acyl-carrier protein] synthase
MTAPAGGGCRSPAPGGVCQARGVIVGVGIDVVDIERFARQLENTPGLRLRLFTEAEQNLPVASLAARFAAKEAIAKALGAPVGLRWTDVTVVRGDNGSPHLQVDGTVADRAAELGATTFHVSLSHDAGIASAVVVAESNGG